MPTYEYKCSSCNHQLEISQKITENPLKECPQCNQETLQRGIGGGSATFRFLGSGFYLTDYKKECCPCGKEKESSCSSSNT